MISIYYDDSDLDWNNSDSSSSQGFWDDSWGYVQPVLDDCLDKSNINYPSDEDYS